MQPTSLKILQIDKEFPPFYGDTITIPENTVLYRGYSTEFPAISTRPAYYGNPETATGYGIGPDKTFGAFKTTRPLQLLDYRFMKVLLKQFFEEITASSKLAKEDSSVIRSVIFSFGLCSLEHQLRILNGFPKVYEDSFPGFQKLKQLFTTPGLIEKQGIRIGETTNDSYTMGFLQGLFEGIFDGFISPEIKSVFHVEKGGVLSPEIILFNPLKSNIQQIYQIPKGTPTLSIFNLIHKNTTRVTIVSKDVQTNFFMKGGESQTALHSFEDVNSNINSKNKKIMGNYLKGLRTGHKFKFNMSGRGISISYSIAPSPHIRGVDLTQHRGEPLQIL